MNKYPFNCVLSCFQRLPACDINVHRRSYPPALFFISDWALSTWKPVLCSGVNAELYCVVCMWAMATFAVAYLSLLLIGFFTCSTLLCLSLQYTQSVSHVDSDGSRVHSFCNLKWHPAVPPSSISLQMKTVETGEEMWFYPHAVWVRCAVYGDLFGCLTADFLPFPMPDFIPIFIPSAMGLLWLAHFLLPVLSWMCHPYSSALASTWIQWCHVYPSRITPLSSVMASEKLFQFCSVRN